ncbi:MAG TPA: lysylphosphatidylglycerol synthase transmembrane domain-containing protein [Phycisphaerae bacterium]|nr:lysylphosphatidylglycerol synthase transmembrane domain-containing protein [Phycisphaerae bacterium]
MTPRAKVWLSALLRYGVCAAALGWLAYDTDWSRLRIILAKTNWLIALAGLAAFGPAPVGLAIRLKVLLAVQNVHLSLWQAIRVTFAGNFVINALPVGTSGGDTVKAFYIARDTPQKHEAVTTVLFDRVLGVLGLLLLSGVIVLCDWHNPAYRLYGRPIAVAIVVLSGGLAFGLSRRLRRLVQFERILALLPMSAHLQRIDRAVLMFRHYPGRLAASMGLSFVLQVVSIFSMFLVGWALGLVGDQPWRAFPVYLAYTPIAFLAGVLPIGVMEVTFRELFADAAGLGPPEAAVSLSFLCRIIQLIWALPGMLVVLRSRPQPGNDLLAADSRS